MWRPVGMTRSSLALLNFEKHCAEIHIDYISYIPTPIRDAAPRRRAMLRILILKHYKAYALGR